MYTLELARADEVELCNQIICEGRQFQREQGFDLRKYRACTVKKYTYAIENASSDSVPICANLLVYEGKIIAADISSAEAEGIVTVLAK